MRRVYNVAHIRHRVMFQTDAICDGEQCGHGDPTGEATKSESDSHSTDLHSEGVIQKQKFLDTTGIVQMLHARKTP